MAYKVLGQTSTTAASSAVVLNLVTDPIFDGVTQTMTALPSGISNYDQWGSIAGTQWYFESRDTSYWSYMRAGNPNTWTGTDDTSGGGIARYGSLSLGMACTSTAGGTSSTTGFAFGLSISSGSSYALRGETSSRFGGPTRSISVTGSTTYYFGCDMLQNAGSDWYYTVYWFTSSGSYISKSTKALSGSSSSWTRNTQTATSPSNAAYAGVEISGGVNRGNTMTLKFDGIYFGTDSAYGSAFKDPSNPTNLLLTAPFTSRYQGTWSGTANASTTVDNFAGAGVTLYTVPAGKSTVISTVTATNASASAQTYRIAVVPNGETLAAKHWIVFDGALPAFSTDAVTIGMTLAAGDSIVVSSDVTSTQFTAFGSES